MPTFTIPRPPSTNGLYANVPKRGRVRTKRYKTWANAAGWDVQRQKPARVDGKVKISLVIERPNRSKVDVSNFIKAVEDLMVDHQLIEDDSLVWSISARWGEVTGCTVFYWPISEGCQQ